MSSIVIDATPRPRKSDYRLLTRGLFSLALVVFLAGTAISTYLISSPTPPSQVLGTAIISVSPTPSSTPTPLPLPTPKLN